jgi:hypothetical protein
MSTFNPPADIAQITLAKSSDVNAVKAATAIAFGLLPSETKLQRGTVNFAVDTGTANTYVVALDSSITSYTDGLQVVFRPLNDNTGSATINLNSLGAKSIRLTDSEPIQAGDISAGAVIDVRYSTSTGFFHLTPNSAIYAHDAGVSATAAAASASTASTQATNAASSASSASTSASSASTSATNAATSASSMTASVASCTASQTAAATSATNAATSASGASTSATTATTQAGIATTQAGIATTQATNASTSASTASTQATNAANSASTASTQATAAGTSATNAATSATNASTSASTASTQASNASTSATNAASSATAASGSASTATTQAGIATTQATNAATSASTATTQASNASTSATNAASSATAAAASYDSFDDRYLGAKSSNPTVDNDGNALLTGALYWNTTSSEMRVYSGSAWITSYLPASGYLALSGGTMTGAITFAAGQTIANLASGSVGTIPYQSASGTTAMLAVGTSGQVLTSAGAAAPTWSTPAAATKTISNKTGAYTVVAGDLGAIINCTSGTFTVSLTAAASLGSGFTCTIWNTGTGAIMIDPNASETIDGFTTWVLRSGEGLAVVCNGTNWLTDDKKPMRAYAENAITHSRPVATGEESVAIGGYCTSAGAYSFSANYGTANGIASIAFGGYNLAAIAGADYSVAFGNNSGGNGSVTASGAGAMALGGSYASGTDSFAAAIGNNTSSYGAQGTQSISVGYRALSTGNSNGMAMGAYSVAGDTGFATAYGTASGYGAISIGYQSTASANYTVAIGTNSAGQGSKAVTGSGAMALGGSYASGTDSFAAAIGNNTSTYGTNGANTIAMGYQNKANSQGAIAIGNSNVVSAMGGYPFSLAIGFGNISRSNAVVLGTYNNIVSSAGDSCIAIGSGHTNNTHQTFTFGDTNTATGIAATAIGRYASALQKGKYAYCGGAAGQSGKLILVANTTTSTAVVLTSDTGAASTTNQLILASNSAMAIQGTLIAHQSGGGMAGWNITGIVSNNAGTMAVSGLALTAIGSDSIALGASPTIAVDNTNKGVTITSGYKSATTIRWVATVNTSELVDA